MNRIIKSGISSVLITMIIIGYIYILFFTSKLYIHEPLSKPTTLGKQNDYMMDHSLTVVNATYDKDKKEMEIQLDLDNTSTDNVDDYYFVPSIKNGKAKKLKITEVYNTPMYTVIRINNLKRNFKELKLFVAPKIKPMNKINDDEYIELIFNKKNISYGNIENHTEKYYLDERYKLLVKNKENEIEELENKLKEYQDKLKSFDKVEKDYADNESYLTDKEKAEYKTRIEQNKEEKSKVTEDIESTQAKLEKCKKELEQLKNNSKE